MYRNERSEFAPRLCSEETVHSSEDIGLISGSIPSSSPGALIGAARLSKVMIMRTQGTRVGLRNKIECVGIIELVNVREPEFAGKRGARQFILQRVDELTPASAEFPFAIPQHINRHAKARSDLVTPSKVDWVRDRRAVFCCWLKWRQELVLETNSSVYRYATVCLPLILDEKALVAAVGASFVPYAIFPPVVSISTALRG